MWRLWTRGWGPRDWWYWFNDQGWPMWIAWHLPRKAALWAFIRVYANGQDGSPGPEYCRAYAAWEHMPAEDKAAVQMMHIPADAVRVPDRYLSGLGYDHGQRREPTHIDLTDPRFDVLWNRLKHLDVTGNDIAALLDELDTAPALGV